MNKFALIVENKEARSVNGCIVTKAGELSLVTSDIDGWVEATSISWSKDEKFFPTDTKLFDSEEEAVDFVKKWGGHPWYCRPNGNFKIVEIKAKFKEILFGYEAVNIK